MSLIGMLADHDHAGDLRSHKHCGKYLEDEWLPHVETQVKPSTFRSVEAHVRLHIAPALGHVLIERLSREDIMDFYARLHHKQATNRDHPLSRSSIQRIHATVHWSLENLVLAGRLPANPAHGLRRRRRRWEAYEFRIWTPRELDRFLTKAQTDPLFPLWRVLAWTGMRRGEALALKWADLRADTRTMMIRRAISVVGGTYSFPRRSPPRPEPSISMVRRSRSSGNTEPLRRALVASLECPLLAHSTGSSPLLKDAS
jgi:integrase